MTGRSEFSRTIRLDTIGPSPRPFVADRLARFRERLNVQPTDTLVAGELPAP